MFQYIFFFNLNPDYCYQVSTEIAITCNTYVYWSEWNAIEGFKKSIRGIKIIIFYFQTE